MIEYSDSYSNRCIEVVGNITVNTRDIFKII